MNAVQLMAVGLCALTAASIGICAELSRKRLKSPFVVGPFVKLALDLKAIAFVCLAIEVAHGGTVTLGSFVVLAACAFTSVAVLTSMLGGSWREALTIRVARAQIQARAQDERLIRDTVKETVAPIAEAMKDWALSDPPGYSEAGGSRGVSLTPRRRV